ncbi:oxidoreductase [Ruegeria sp. AD91A]|uniref:molybdopterin-dependent oxidoreductase n=1 Tax=Ruegeria sp. AD91A TaxID=2293862 RepID=UPI000E52252B|nr:molybdopterin-dependent oxidoreductase [Ruegeria sp. AD91A]AXT27075.1 oxidoreductase [Ruegeria sp. AD91A]
MAQKHYSRIYIVLFMLLLSLVTPATARAEMTLEVTTSGSNSATVEFSLQDLDAMDQVTFSTSTIWTDDKVTFSGVPLKALLTELNTNGTSIEMVALNDYKVTMPLAELENDAPIIATRMDGETMSVRDKGPYWVVFPYDQDPKYRAETIYTFSIWQLKHLKVVD